MIVRSFDPSDNEKLKKIHALFYSEEFEFPNFLKNFLCAFVVEDDNGNIITAGGVRNIPELILITDKSKSVRDRKLGLLEALQISNYVCKHWKHKHIHVFVQEDNWLKRLLRSGFRKPKGQPVIIDVV